MQLELGASPYCRKRRRSIHNHSACAQVVTHRAVEVAGNARFVLVGFAGLVHGLLVVVPHVRLRGRSRFVLAVLRHGSKTPLQGEDKQHDDGQETLHEAGV